jgi:hypothetical protein
MTPPSFLQLGPDRLLVMSVPEPRRFVSRVKVFTEDGHEAEGDVEVNSPVTAGDWRVYQYGYETGLGPLSPWSRFLLVSDGWRDLARAGFIMWLLGSIGLVLSGRVTPAPAGGSVRITRAGARGGSGPEGAGEAPHGAAADGGPSDGAAGGGGAGYCVASDGDGAGGDEAPDSGGGAGGGGPEGS